MGDGDRRKTRKLKSEVRPFCHGDVALPVVFCPPDGAGKQKMSIALWTPSWGNT